LYFYAKGKSSLRHRFHARQSAAAETTADTGRLE
jgi:hypothetical protein